MKEDERPSGMSHATTATSASIQSMKFVAHAYSALQCSARCFPATSPSMIIKTVHACMHI